MSSQQPDQSNVERVTTREEAHAWCAGPLGCALIGAERRVLDTILPNLFGYHLVQIGGLCIDPAQLVASRIQHRVFADVDAHPDIEGAVQALARALPLASDSVDAVLLNHTLEFHQNPHQVLREADRVLIPEGHLVILGFNPWSGWGLGRFLPGVRRRVPWNGRFLSATRLKDWLSLLGFDLLHEQGFFYRPPVGYRGLLEKLDFLERWGRWPIPAGGYALLARKRVSTLTPVWPRWHQRRLVIPGLIKPTARGVRWGQHG